MSNEDRQTLRFLIDGLKTGLCVPSVAAERLAEIESRIPDEIDAELHEHNVWWIESKRINGMEIDSFLGRKAFEGMKLKVSVRDPSPLRSQ